MFLQNFHLIDYNMLVFTIIILARRLIAAIVKEVRIQLLAFVSLYFLLIQGLGVRVIKNISKTLIKNTSCRKTVPRSFFFSYL